MAEPVKIPFDTSDIRKKLADARANPKTTTDDKTTNNDPSKHRREMADVSKYREKVKELTAQIQNKDATLEEKNKAVADLQKLNEDQATRLAEAEKQVAELKPIAEAKKAEDHRRRSLLLEKIPKEERKDWQDADIRLLEKYVGKAPAGGTTTDTGGKPDFKKLINDSGSDEGMKSLNSAIEKHRAAFEEYNKQGVK